MAILTKRQQLCESGTLGTCGAHQQPISIHPKKIDKTTLDTITPRKLEFLPVIVRDGQFPKAMKAPLDHARGLGGAFFVSRPVGKRDLQPLMEE